MQKNIIGVDLGATSGRVILARAGDDRLRMEELHRFPNRMREIDGRFYWDIHALYEEILRGLSVAGGRGERIDSIGIDTWGVDFACVDPDGDLLGLPRAYRDPYTDGVPEEFFRTVPRESVYAKTGIQVMNFNSLYQLYALNREHSPALAAAEHVLFMPDALSYLLTGEQVCEYTILSTSQLMNPRTRELDGELLRAAGVDASLFARRVMPGERVGVLRDEVARRTGLGRVEVFAVAGHDTASAIAAVPAADERFAYLSSGTWSLMGIELPAPVITEESCAMNFTNEGGYHFRYRFLKNIMGLWMNQSIRRELNGITYVVDEKAIRKGRLHQYMRVEGLGHEVGFADLIKAADEAEAAGVTASIVNVNDERFLSPDSMIEEICAACEESGQPVPETLGELMHCVYESLALCYREAVEGLSQLAGHEDASINIGGGCRDGHLNRRTAEVCGLPVYAGPVEGTALGNLAVQMLADGVFPHLKAVRAAIAESFDVQKVEP